MYDSQFHIYLNDHLALMRGEVRLANHSRSTNHGSELGDFLGRLKNEVDAQSSVIRDVLYRTAGRESRVKQGVVWMAKKLVRLKLNGSPLKPSDLSRLVELEAITAGAKARIALWQSLEQMVWATNGFWGSVSIFFDIKPTSILKS